MSGTIFHSLIIRNLFVIVYITIAFQGISQNPVNNELGLLKIQTAKYNISMLGANVGEFSVNQISEGENVKIEAITDVKVNLLFSYRIKYIQNTVYNNGVLQHSQIETYKNDKLNSTVFMKLEGDSYLVVNDGDTMSINEPITYSGSLVYFNEPKNIKQIYKERSSEMIPITSVGEHIYITKDEKEKELNRYFYDKGVLEFAKMRHVLGTLEMKRISND